MIKQISKFFLIIFFLITLFILYLSFIGLNTSFFNKHIQKKIKDTNQALDVNFKEADLLLNLKNLNLKIKLEDPTIKLNQSEFVLNKLVFYLSIKSFFNKDFAVQKIEASLNDTKIKDISKAIYQLNKSPIYLILNQIVVQGKLNGEAIINFDELGKIKNDYHLKGSLINLHAKFLKKFEIQNLNGDFEIKDKNQKIYSISGNFNNFNFSGSSIDIKKIKNDLNISGNLSSTADLNDLKKVLLLFNSKLDLSKIESSKISYDASSSFSFLIKDFKKVEKIKINLNGKIKSSEIGHKFFSKEISKRIKNLDKQLKLKNSDLKFFLDKNGYSLDLDGLISLSNKKDNFKKINSKISYSNKNKTFSFENYHDLSNLDLDFININYKKVDGKKATLNYQGTYIVDKKLLLDSLDYKESENLISIKKIELNKNFKLKNLSEISVKTKNENILNNQFNIKKKNKDIKIKGNFFDGRPFLDNFFKKKDDKDGFLSKKFNSKIKANIKHIYTANHNDLLDFSMISEIKNGQIHKLSTKGNFSEKEILEVSMYTLSSGDRELKIISDRAEPFIQGLNFIKGFRKGRLEYDSLINKDFTKGKSKLRIFDFKVQNVSGLTQLLTLASLQGIADTLTGEGIRFNELDMDFHKENNQFVIDELYSIGPAISILMNGYIDQGNIVSLRGTLIPATTLNKVIGSIPLLGKILVGSKKGEGVFGVSFKMKGPENDLKTTVNPIKTLTPRFVTRTLEKIKKGNTN